MASDRIKEAASVRELLAWGADFLKAHGIENPKRNAEQLLGHLLDLDRFNLYLSEHQTLDLRQRSDYEALLEKRASNIPLQYLTGRSAFLENEFAVDPRVLIPRPETEFLTEEARRRLAAVKHPFVIDIGTGCGNIAVILAKTLKAKVWATDVSAEALEVARLNAGRLGAANRITFVQGDLLQPLKGIGLEGKIDLVISNPPYIRRTEFATLPSEVRLHEPRVALDGGEDGLVVYRKLIPEAGAFLKEGGFLILEMGDGMSREIATLVASQGLFGRIELLQDLAGRERILITRRKGS